MKPKIYISHPRLSLEETAEMVGVSKRRLKELKVIINNLVGAEAARQSKTAGKTSAHERTQRTASR